MLKMANVSRILFWTVVCLIWTTITLVSSKKQTLGSIGNVTHFKEESLLHNNSDGLYLLNQSVSRKSELQSFELLGRVPSQSEKKIGVLLLVLENRKNMLHVKSVLKADYNDNISSGGIIKIDKSTFHQLLSRGDYIGLYLPKIGDSALQIETNESGVKFAFLKGSRKIKKSLTDLKSEVKKLVNRKKWSKWRKNEGHLNFRVTIKLGNKRTDSKPAESGDKATENTIKVIIIGATITIFFLVLLVIIVILVLKVSKRKPRGAEGMLLEDIDGNDERAPNQHSTVRYIAVQPDKKGQSKTVLSIHNYYNNSSSCKNSTNSKPMPKVGEYCLLSEEEPVKELPSHHGDVMLASDNHDYDEPYFEPASKEEGLLLQLKEMGIPIVLSETIKLLTDEVLGSGAFGCVYKGIYSSGNSSSKSGMTEEVAVKTMEDGSSEEDRIKFLQEAAIMGQFDHPNIIKILGVIIERQNCRIVVSIMQNGDLLKHLQIMQENVNKQELAASLLSCSRHVANGMMYLEMKCFIHRDLAARNILVDHDGICKIADFGLSRALLDDYYVSHGGKIPVKWTAPEALHYRKYSTASDVWSYGCVLYEIWSLGEKPYKNYTNEQIVQELPAGFCLPPPPGCPRDVYKIMTECWHPDAAKRPSFTNITTLLQKPDFQILKWNEEDDKSLSKEARTLGEPLEAGNLLHKDLQKIHTLL